tara:strand:- start:362 stop:580 length:219 start_codon:yes stop_codon:yes gene_type:complete
MCFVLIIHLIAKATSGGIPGNGCHFWLKIAQDFEEHSKEAKDGRHNLAGCIGQILILEGKIGPVGHGMGIDN